jgi:para-nitrobenzyl esterase
VKLSNFAHDIDKVYGSDAIGQLANESLKIYPATTDAEARESRGNFERDLRFGWVMWTWARLQAKTGKGEVFYYYFAHLPPAPQGSPFADWGAGHWAELPYVFGHLRQYEWAWTDADRALADTMATYSTTYRHAPGLLHSRYTSRPACGRDATLFRNDVPSAQL